MGRSGACKAMCQREVLNKAEDGKVPLQLLVLLYAPPLAIFLSSKLPSQSSSNIQTQKLGAPLGGVGICVPADPVCTVGAVWPGV